MAPDLGPPPETDRGTLQDFLPPADIVRLPALRDAEWNQLRQTAMRRLAWHFCTLRNLLVHRGRYLEDVIGYGWGGIYRSLQVRGIVTTSFRNEGHFRAGERIFGTGDFFSGAFRLARQESAFAELVRLVNLRHHVAGVVIRQDDGVRVLAGFEADYAYVATAFVESLRRGYEACGVPPQSRRGREIGTELCGILYQVAGFTGLRRVPRDLAAHERFRDAYERALAADPPSPRVRRMAQEIARRIVPLTAAMAGTSVRGHVARHLDEPTRELLFPGIEVPEELEHQRAEWCRRLAHDPSLLAIETRAAERQVLRQREDVVALEAAYRAAPAELTADRLIGAILLHLLDGDAKTARPLERRVIELEAGEALIRQGEAIGEMYVLLATTNPLVVLRSTEKSPAEPREIALLTAPTVLGEIGMWRGQPAMATVLSRKPNRLDMLVIDAEQFTQLKEESGFRAATAAEVQRRLAFSATQVGRLLDDVAVRAADPLLASITQLLRYLSGDPQSSLDAVIDLPEEATPAACVDALRQQTDEAIRSGGLPLDLERQLANVVATIG